MLQEFFVPLATLVLSMATCVCVLHWLCQFHQIYLDTSGRLESERWLVEQCADPHFFTKMHLHTDLCFIVTNNARIGVFMLSLQEFTRNAMGVRLLEHAGDWAWLGGRVFSWGGVGFFLCFLFFGPSCLFGGTRSFSRRWPDCRDDHFKDA